MSLMWVEMKQDSDRLNYHGKMNAFAEVYLGQGIQEWTKTNLPKQTISIQIF